MDEPSLSGDLLVETVFQDRLVVAVGTHHPLARRRKVKWAQLVDLPWAVTGWNSRLIEEAFKAEGLRGPRVLMSTLSVHLRARMAATMGFVTALPSSILLLHGANLHLKSLPLELPSPTWPVLAVTVRNRMPSPVVEGFLADLRATAQLLGSRDVAGRSD